MAKQIKRKLMYSYAGIGVSGIVICLLMQFVSLIVRREFFSPVDILKIYIVISAVYAAAITAAGISLVIHEGLRVRKLIGIFLGALWLVGNLICFVLISYYPLSGLFGGFAGLFGCYIDFLISGILLSAYTAAKHRPEYDKDFVVILGCSISKNGGLLPLLKGRTNRAIRFAWDQERACGKSARFIPTGGQGADEIMSEGTAMELYLMSHGAEQYEILTEKASVNTYENMLFSKKIIDDAKADAKVCFVTTNYHVLRSGMLAKKVGLDAEGLASSTKWYFWPNGLAREIFAIFFMDPFIHIAAGIICFAAAWIMNNSV